MARSLICVSQTSPEAGVEVHFRNLQLSNASSQSNVVNMSPGMSREKLQNGVVFYFHDYPEEGQVTKVVSTDFPDLMSDGEYHEIEGFTGTNVRARVVKDVEFPRLLDPVDDLPPATVVTYPAPKSSVRLNNGRLRVRGTTTDNVKTRRVVVNGVEASDVDYNLHLWEVELEGLKPGPITLVAHAEDAEGNVEQTPHRVVVVGR